MILLFSVVLILLIILGAPLFAAVGASALVGFSRLDYDLITVINEFYYGIFDESVLLAIPLFTFAGFVLSEGQAPRRLVRLSEAMLGWLPGGLAVISLTACALFTAFTGASGITIIALGAVLYPALTASGYRERFSLGLITTSGSLGLLFAPSLPLILYGIISQVPIGDLFRAGILPGLLMIVLLSLYSVMQRREVRVARQPLSWRALWAAVVDGRYEIPLPFVVLGGIYSGFFAASEAATVTVIYVLISEFVIRREIPLARLPGIVRDSMVLVGAIFMILGLSQASTNYMTSIDVPQRLFGFLSQYISSEAGFLVVLLVFLLVLGAILDIFSAIVLVVPLIVPVALQFGTDPVHLGIVFLAAMELGYLTPPVGINLFLSSYRFDRDIAEVYWSTLPFFVVLLLCVLLITFIPQLSLLLR